MTGNFIDDSLAVGCFLAIQSNITNEIIYFVLKRNGDSRHLYETLPLPPSTYTVYAHDLEEGAVINTHPANLDPDNVPMITVTGKRESVNFSGICMGHYCCVHTDPSPPSYKDLDNATISQNGPTVTVDCHPDGKTTSCVVVYRAYGNSTLNVVDKVNSLTVALETGNYTFAIFRRTSDSDIDERPFISRMIVVDGIPPPKVDFGNIMKLIFMYQQYKLHANSMFYFL